MGECFPLLITLHSVGLHWKYLQCFKLLENIFSLTLCILNQNSLISARVKWLFWQHWDSGNTKLSLSVNLTTLSKQNSGSVWQEVVFATPGPMEYTAKTGGSGSRCSQLLFYHLPCYFSSYGKLTYSCGWQILPCSALVLFFSWAILAGCLRKGKEREQDKLNST